VTRMRYGEAIDYALGQAMAEDETIFMWGEDCKLLHKELLARYGPSRIKDTPISEGGFMYAGIGAAMNGMRPVVELMLIDFLPSGWVALTQGAAKFPAFSGDRINLPIVFRGGIGGWYTDGGQHESTMWGPIAAFPGLKVVAPSTPADAAGLMLSAVQDDMPVVFLEHQLLVDQMLDYLGGDSRATVDFSSLRPADGIEGEVPTPVQPVPIGEAALRREGGDVALISLSVGAHRCAEAAELLAADGIEASVLDLRSVYPLDREAVIEQANKAGRVVVVDEDYIRGGLTGEIAAVLMESGTSAKYARVAVEETLGFAPELEYAGLPNKERIVSAAKGLE
jgi:pyruvate/2-oxoglutarate/acetoin dehydrogenase E1 component